MGSPPPQVSQEAGPAARAHGFHRLEVKAVVEETADSRSFVLAIPAGMEEAFRYRAGQFCTFRVRIGADELLRSYSMSSAPETDSELAVTVKRVPGGAVSNWLVDRVRPGDTLEVTRPAGVFCLEERDGPVVAFCGGSGVTPIMSITKKALATTSRPVRVLYANRTRDSVIFAGQLDRLQERFGDRLELHYHFDCDRGYVSDRRVLELIDRSPGAGFYICGPAPFMDLVESTLVAAGVPRDRIFIERFGAAPVDPAPARDGEAPGQVTIVMRGRPNSVPYKRGDTVLETARRGKLNPPFSCEAGTCATCMAMLREGTVAMRTNEALTPEEVAEGWILTCQSVPTSSNLTVEYEAL